MWPNIEIWIEQAAAAFASRELTMKCNFNATAAEKMKTHQPHICLSLPKQPSELHSYNDPFLTPFNPLLHDALRYYFIFKRFLYVFSDLDGTKYEYILY